MVDDIKKKQEEFKVKNTPSTAKKERNITDEPSTPRNVFEDNTPNKLKHRNAD
jgi:hypothetical protein